MQDQVLLTVLETDSVVLNSDGGGWTNYSAQWVAILCIAIAIGVIANKIRGPRPPKSKHQKRDIIP